MPKDYDEEVCGHKSNEDCLICSICGNCDDSLDENDICASCHDEDDDDLLACQYCDEEFPEAELKLVDGWELCPKCIADGVNAEKMDDHIEDMADFVDRVSKDHPLDDF